MQNTVEQQTARRDKVAAEIADMQTYVASDEYKTLTAQHQDAIGTNIAVLSNLKDILDVRLTYLGEATVEEVSA